MGVDLHRIGTGISSGTSRTGFGTIVSFPSAPSFPAYGTFNSWINDSTYPAVNGGTEVSVTYLTSTYSHPNQNCDVQLKNDGAGGTYTDWATVTDVQYKPNGEQITSFSEDAYASFTSSCNGSQSHYLGQTFTTFYHDGTGGSYTAGGGSYSSYGTALWNETCGPFDDGNGGEYYNTYNYFSDGNGGYYVT